MKGQVQLKAIVVFLAVLVLAIVIFGLYRSGVLEKIGILIPGLNSTKEPLKVDGLVGYNLESDVLEFYDGIKWYELKDKVDFDGKIITSESLRKDLLTDFYFRISARENIKYDIDAELLGEVYNLPSDIMLKFVISGDWPFNACVSKLQNNGDVIFSLVSDALLGNKCSGDLIYGELTVKKSGEVYIRKLSNNLETLEESGSKVINQEFIEEIVDVAEEWKFSVLKKPVTIHYTDDVGDFSLVVCVEKDRNIRLIADLSKPAGESC